MGQRLARPASLPRTLLGCPPGWPTAPAQPRTPSWVGWASRPPGLRVPRALGSHARPPSSWASSWAAIATASAGQAGRSGTVRQEAILSRPDLSPGQIASMRSDRCTCPRCDRSQHARSCFFVLACTPTNQTL
jgi:hypothetical protein